jgi:uncharacterized membrane protein YcaP (DUF421 family)
MTLILQDMMHIGIPVLEKIVRPMLVYVFLVFALRLGGKRELAQINTFDLVVLLTLSNTVQNAIIGKDDSLLGGLIGATALVSVNAIAVHFIYAHPLLTKILEGDPEYLIKDGEIQNEQLKKEGMSRYELEGAAHRQGFASLEAVDTARLESGGAISFIGKTPTEEAQRHDEVLKRLDALQYEIFQLRKQLPS